MKEKAKENNMDSKVIEALKNRDIEAFRLVYVEYANKLCAYIDSIIHNHFDAIDVTEDVFLGLFSSISTFDETKGSFETWLFSIAKHAAFSYQRRQKNISQENDFSEYEAENTTDQIIILSDLKSILTNEEYDIVMLKFFDSYTNSEIANKLNCSLSTFKRKLNVIYHKVRKYYTEY